MYVPSLHVLLILVKWLLTWWWCLLWLRLLVDCDKKRIIIITLYYHDMHVSWFRDNTWGNPQLGKTISQ